MSKTLRSFRIQLMNSSSFGAIYLPHEVAFWPAGGAIVIPVMS